jgi:uncharacterized protein (TIGR02117 family)
MQVVRLLLFFISCSLFGCATVDKHGHTPPPSTRKEKIWLVSNGFHTSVAIQAKHAEPQLRQRYPKARFFVLGWGGRSMYMAPKLRPWHVLNAILLPSSAALHVIPVERDLTLEMTRSEIIEFEICSDGLKRLQARLTKAFSRDGNGDLIYCGPGKLPASHFYRGSEIYIFPKTCNLWAAQGLQTAGVPITACTAIVADNIIWQGRKHGVIRRYYHRPLEAL